MCLVTTRSGTKVSDVVSCKTEAAQQWPGLAQVHGQGYKQPIKIIRGIGPQSVLTNVKHVIASTLQDLSRETQAA